LSHVLTTAGYDGTGLVKVAQAGENGTRQNLIENNKRAFKQGVFGVPTFQVDGGEIIWGYGILFSFIRFC
jgi:2-hydroxychromene-2-carboxylate isomerase